MLVCPFLQFALELPELVFGRRQLLAHGSQLLLLVLQIVAYERKRRYLRFELALRQPQIGDLRCQIVSRHRQPLAHCSQNACALLYGILKSLRPW